MAAPRSLSLSRVLRGCSVPGNTSQPQTGSKLREAALSLIAHVIPACVTPQVLYNTKVSLKVLHFLALVSATATPASASTIDMGLDRFFARDPDRGGFYPSGYLKAVWPGFLGVRF